MHTQKKLNHGSKDSGPLRTSYFPMPVVKQHESVDQSRNFRGELHLPNADVEMKGQTLSACHAKDIPATWARFDGS